MANDPNTDPAANIRWLGAYAALYLVAAGLLIKVEDYPPSEIIGVFLVFALGLPGLAWFTVRRAVPLAPPRPPIRGEPAALLMCGVLVVLLLAVGPSGLVERLGVEPSTRAGAVLVVVTKWVVFVLVPWAAFRALFAFGPRDFGLTAGEDPAAGRRHWTPLIVLSLALLSLQWLASQAAAPIRDGTYPGSMVLIAMPLAFAWQFLSVGVVEEFFFRSLLQSRLSAILRSPAGGLVVSAVLFGLAHVPGLMLRGAGARSPVGPDPSLWLATGHSIVVLSAAGLFLGVVWWRTRNLWLVAAIHAATDLLPGLPRFIETWMSGAA